MYEAAGDAKNTAAPTISSGSAIRLSGTRHYIFLNSEFCPEKTPPGVILFTLIPTSPQ